MRPLERSMDRASLSSEALYLSCGPCLSSLMMSASSLPSQQLLRAWCVPGSLLGAEDSVTMEQFPCPQ